MSIIWMKTWIILCSTNNNWDSHNIMFQVQSNWSCLPSAYCLLKTCFNVVIDVSGFHDFFAEKSSRNSALEIGIILLHTLYKINTKNTCWAFWFIYLFSFPGLSSAGAGGGTFLGCLIMAFIQRRRRKVALEKTEELPIATPPSKGLATSTNRSSNF